jgi:LuxR family transcriptional regulator, quorum-sensing system regulator SdiA
MTALVDDLAEGLAEGASLDDGLDRLLALLEPYGFTSVVYDYAPVPRSHDGKMIRPNLMRARRLPADFVERWCDKSYFRIDPVQQICIDCNIPFVWSVAGQSRHILERPITREHEPVVSYLKESRLTCGATVPIHLVDGGLATLTAIRIDAERDFAREARRRLGELFLLAHVMHESAYASFDAATRTCPAVRISQRETECLRWAARGKTAADIARILGRSTATVSLHLNNAQHKLGASNRAQAIARAAHYRLLGPGI